MAPFAHVASTLISTYPAHPAMNPVPVRTPPRRVYGGEQPMLQTQRLRIRRWESRDVRPFVQLCADPAVMQFFSGTLTPIGCFTEMERQEVCFDTYQYGIWVVELKQTGEFLGCVGIDPTMLDPKGMTARLTWKLRRQCWGMGYAYEAAMEVMDYAFTQLEVEKVIAIIHPTNLRSLRLAERLGLERDTEIEDCYSRSVY